MTVLETVCRAASSELRDARWPMSGALASLNVAGERLSTAGSLSSSSSLSLATACELLALAERLRGAPCSVRLPMLTPEPRRTGPSDDWRADVWAGGADWGRAGDEGRAMATAAAVSTHSADMPGDIFGLSWQRRRQDALAM